MKKPFNNAQSGFTLIEVVVVIVILGILSATAIPKFLDLQGDARAATMKGLKGALEGAATLTFSRAAIDGYEKNSAAQNAALINPYTVNGAIVEFGYPVATKMSLESVAELSAGDWSFKLPIRVTTPSSIEITLANDSSGCMVVYQQAQVDQRPVIQVSGCEK